MEIARYYSQHEIDVFVGMFNACLGTQIGSRRRQRTVRYASCLFRFLASGLRLLQDDYIANAPAKNALRERIYATAMDYFAGPLDFPQDFKGELRDDIKVVDAVLGVDAHGQALSGPNGGAGLAGQR